MEVTIQEKRNRRIAAAIAVTFLLLAFKCSSQIESEPMKFGCGVSDTIYVKIASDSLYEHSKLIVSCSGHYHTEWTSITIGFTDGYMLEIPVKGDFAILDTQSLKCKEFDFLSFDEEFESKACINIKTKDYFINFFNKVKN